MKLQQVFQANNPIFFVEYVGWFILVPLVILWLYWKAAQDNAHAIGFRHFYFIGVGLMLMSSGVLVGVMVAINPILFWPLYRAWNKPDNRVMWRMTAIFCLSIAAVATPLSVRQSMEWGALNTLFAEMMIPYLSTLPLSIAVFIETRIRFSKQSNV